MGILCDYSDRAFGVLGDDMSEHTPTPWKVYDDTDPHHVKILGRHQDIGNAHIADVLFPENAAFIVKAANNHDDLITALRRIVSLDKENAARYAQSIASEAIAKVSSCPKK